MTRVRLVWVLAIVAVLILTIASILVLSRPTDLRVGKAKMDLLPAGQPILVDSRAERVGVQKGDAFSYIVDVLYDPEQVDEIDASSLDRNVNLEPFEVRRVEETEFSLDSGTRVFRREYELQLINGAVDHLYEFPTLVVRYTLKGPRQGFAEKAGVPEPIYVASRLPADVDEMDLGYGPIRPLKGEIVDPNQRRLPWVLGGLGGLLAVLAITDLIFRVVPRSKETAGGGAMVECNDVLVQAYRSLCSNAATSSDAKGVLHQIDHILRIVLAREEKVQWLEDPDPSQVSLGARPTVVALWHRCQNSHGPQPSPEAEIGEALRQLDEILVFYYGEGELAAWRS